MSTELLLRTADYTLSDEQAAVRDAFASFFERECPTSRVRAAEPGGFDGDLWTRLVEMRIVAMGLPESVGGDGAGLIELGLVAEQMGRRLAPVPMIESVVAARALASVAESTGDVLADTVAGNRLIVLALHPFGGPQLVPGAAVADGVLGLVGEDLVLTTSASPPRTVANQGYAPMAWWDLSGEGVESVTLASGPRAIDVFERAVAEWELLMAWALIGMGSALLDIGVEHAKSRVAFGAPIGTYQAVSHALVNVSMGVDTGRRLVSKASWFAENDPTAETHLAPMAYVYAEETAMNAAIVGVHVLGGVGFTVESDAQLYFRRVKGWTLVSGDLSSHLSDVADRMFGPANAADR